MRRPVKNCVDTYLILLGDALREDDHRLWIGDCMAVNILKCLDRVSQPMLTFSSEVERTMVPREEWSSLGEPRISSRKF